MVSENISLTVDSFGTVEDHISKEQKEVKRFTWKNSKSNVSVQVGADVILIDDAEELIMNLHWICLFIQLLSYGAMIHSVKVPSKTGEIADVALGFDTIDGECCVGNKL